MDVILIPILDIAYLVLSLYTYALLVGIALHWLIILRIVDSYHPLVARLSDLYAVLTDPFYYRIRQVLPMIGTVDLSPLVLLLGVQFLQGMIGRILLRLS